MLIGRFGVAAVAGVVGGMAEVLWIAAATTALGADGWGVARAVGVTVFPDMAGSSFAPGIGLAVHFLLSIVLATVFVQALGRQRSTTALVLGSLGVLVAVWVFNFFLLLPLINPAFVSLLPLSVTLVSKLMFGLAMATVLELGRKGVVLSRRTLYRASA